MSSFSVTPNNIIVIWIFFRIVSILEMSIWILTIKNPNPTVWTRVLILDGNSEISMHVWSDLGYLIFICHLFRPRAATILFFLPKRHVYLHTCATFSELPSDIRTGPTDLTVPGGREADRELGRLVQRLGRHWMPWIMYGIYHGTYIRW